MNFRVLVISVIILAGGMALRNYKLEAMAPVPAAELEKAILASTVQIAMFEHAPAGGSIQPGSRGLGTLVSTGDDTLIVTHDHWAHFTPNLHEVELSDARGRLLLRLDAQAFRALITYRDGGTMVLQAPDSLQDSVPVTLGPPAATGDVVWFARRNPTSRRTTVEVVAATVMAVEDVAHPMRMRLRNTDGSGVIPGDSGGGVWANGRLVANVWAAGVWEAHAFCCDWFGGSHNEPSDLVIAALQPLGEQAVAAAAEHGLGIYGELEISTKQDQLHTTLLAD